MIFVLGGLGIAFCAGGIWYLVRRWAPILSDNDIKFLEQTKGVRLQSVSKLSEAQKDAIKESFLAGPDFRWMVVGGDGSHPDFTKKEESTEVVLQHRNVTRYMLECVLRYSEKYGHILICTDDNEDGESKSEDERFLGSLCLAPPNSLHSIQFLLSVFPMGSPEPKKISQAVGARFDAYCKETEGAAHKINNGKPCWHIFNLGVSSNAQGKGVGTKLVEAAIALWEKMGNGEPIFLECHDENVAFYKKRGFKIFQRYMINPKIDNGEDNTPFPYNTMVFDRSLE